jgi:hypothetical protein
MKWKYDNQDVKWSDNQDLKWSENMTIKMCAYFFNVILAIWFRYDLSPITVKYVERRKPFYHFITTVSIDVL